MLVACLRDGQLPDIFIVLENGVEKVAEKQAFPKFQKKQILENDSFCSKLVVLNFTYVRQLTLQTVKRTQVAFDHFICKGRSSCFHNNPVLIKPHITPQ